MAGGSGSSFLQVAAPIAAGIGSTYSRPLARGIQSGIGVANTMTNIGDYWSKRKQQEQQSEALKDFIGAKRDLAKSQTLYSTSGVDNPLPMSERPWLKSRDEITSMYGDMLGLGKSTSPAETLIGEAQTPLVPGAERIQVPVMQQQAKQAIDELVGHPTDDAQTTMDFLSALDIARIADPGSASRFLAEDQLGQMKSMRDIAKARTQAFLDQGTARERILMEMRADQLRPFSLAGDQQRYTPRGDGEYDVITNTFKRDREASNAAFDRDTMTQEYDRKMALERLKQEGDLPYTAASGSGVILNRREGTTTPFGQPSSGGGRGGGKSLDQVSQEQIARDYLDVLQKASYDSPELRDYAVSMYDRLKEIGVGDNFPAPPQSWRPQAEGTMNIPGLSPAASAIIKRVEGSRGNGSR